MHHMCSFTDGHWIWSSSLSPVNNDDENIHVQFMYGLMFSLLSNMKPRWKLLDHLVIRYGISRRFSDCLPRGGTTDAANVISHT